MFGIFLRTKSDFFFSIGFSVIKLSIFEICKLSLKIYMFEMTGTLKLRNYHSMQKNLMIAKQFFFSIGFSVIKLSIFEICKLSLKIYMFEMTDTLKFRNYHSIQKKLMIANQFFFLERD